MTKNLSGRHDDPELKELHTQLTSIANMLSIHPVFLLVRYSINIALGTTGTSSLSLSIKWYLLQLRAIKSIYNQITENRILQLEHLKEKSLSPVSVWNIAELIANYNMGDVVQGMYDGHMNIVERELDRLKKIQKAYKQGWYNELMSFIDEHLQAVESYTAEENMRIKNVFFTFNPIFTADISLIHESQSPTRPKDIYFNYLFENIFAIIKKQTGLSNEAVVGTIVDLFKLFAVFEEKRLSEAALLKRLKSDRALGFAERKLIFDEEKSFEQFMKKLRSRKTVRVRRHKDIKLVEIDESKADEEGGLEEEVNDLFYYIFVELQVVREAVSIRLVNKEYCKLGMKNKYFGEPILFIRLARGLFREFALIGISPVLKAEIVGKDISFEKMF